MVAAKNGRLYVVPADTASLNLRATVDGQGGGVQATNATAIQFYTVGSGVGPCDSPQGCYVNRPFTVSYVDNSNSSWQLDVGSGYWER